VGSLFGGNVLAGDLRSDQFSGVRTAWECLALQVHLRRDEELISETSQWIFPIQLLSIFPAEVLEPYLCTTFDFVQLHFIF
jgi:hypothetical protein